MREIINRLEEQEVNPAINANEFELLMQMNLS